MRPALKVLVLARSYPNAVLPNLGLWVERLVQQVARTCPVRVISPVPYCPPLPVRKEYSRFREVSKQTYTGGVPVYHPRLLLGPGRSTYNLEALAYYFSVRKLVAGLWREFRFDLIHAHFSYPDGVVAPGWENGMACRSWLPSMLPGDPGWITTLGFGGKPCRCIQTLPRTSP